MGDAEDVLPPSKKRAAGRELSRDNPGLDDEEDVSEQETGTFKRASDEVLASRRIVKVRRQQTASVPSSNPFAGICLVPPTESSVPVAELTSEGQTASKKTDTEDGNGKDDAIKGTAESSTDKDAVEKSNDAINEEVKTEADKEQVAGGNKNDTGGDIVDQTAESTPLNSFQQLSSSQNAFTGLAGTGFSSSTFSFGTIAKDGAAFGSSSGPILGLKDGQASSPTFSFGVSSNGNSSLFGTSGTSIVSKSAGTGFPPLQEVPVQTGEENEKAVFTADSVLFEFLDGGWKERGKGEFKVNVSTTGTEKARLVMRAKGNYRLILNASLYADMKLTNMDKRGITFACMNSTGEEKTTLTTFAVKFKDASIREEFCAAVTAHKGETAPAPVLKTPENSP